MGGHEPNPPHDEDETLPNDTARLIEIERTLIVRADECETTLTLNAAQSRCGRAVSRLC
jgi:hypothetical protein